MTEQAPEFPDANKLLEISLEHWLTSRPDMSDLAAKQQQDDMRYIYWEGDSEPRPSSNS